MVVARERPRFFGMRFFDMRSPGNKLKQGKMQMFDRGLGRGRPVNSPPCKLVKV